MINPKHLLRMIVVYLVLEYSLPYLNQLFFDNPDAIISYAIFFPIIFAVLRVREDIGFLRGIFTGFKVFIPGMYLMTLPFGLYYFLVLFYLITIWDDYRFNKPAKGNTYSDMDGKDWREFKERKTYTDSIWEAEKELEYENIQSSPRLKFEAENVLKDRIDELDEFDRTKWERQKEKEREQFDNEL